MNNKIMLLGLPRSGTTIVTNYLYSQPDIFIFSEPHWQFSGFRTKKFFHDVKLRGMKRGWYNFLSKTPLLNSLACLSHHYKCVGFKETYRGEAYKPYKKKLYNGALIQAYINQGYDVLYILRNPVDVWNSMLRFGGETGDGWASDLNAFIKNVDDLYTRVDSKAYIIYEDFISDARASLSQAGFDMSLIKTDDLIPRDIGMGDERANLSQAVKKSPSKKIISKDDEQKIKQSNGYARYMSLKGEAK